MNDIIADGDIKAAISGLLNLISADRENPNEVVNLLTDAASAWMQSKPGHTTWRLFTVDGYRFSIKRNANGELEISRDY